MALPHDPAMLLSVVNTLLRDRYHDLDALCDGEQTRRSALDQRLARIGYTYMPKLNQFR